MVFEAAQGNVGMAHGGGDGACWAVCVVNYKCSKYGHPQKRNKDYTRASGDKDKCGF